MAGRAIILMIITLRHSHTIRYTTGAFLRGKNITVAVVGKILHEHCQ